MNTALWIAQVVLALAFAAAGIMKLTQHKDKLYENMQWVEDFSAGTIRLIGGLELLAAVGLILPALTGILPVLTPLAAVGLLLVQIGAAVTHARRGEYPNIVANVVLGLLAAFVAYGRFVLFPL